VEANLGLGEIEIQILQETVVFRVCSPQTVFHLLSIDFRESIHQISGLTNRALPNIHLDRQFCRPRLICKPDHTLIRAIRRRIAAVGAVLRGGGAGLLQTPPMARHQLDTRLSIPGNHHLASGVAQRDMAPLS
jgi:hypothetical protein